MNIKKFQDDTYYEESFSDFQDLLLGSTMKYLASDLIRDGLSPSTINLAVEKAISVCLNADIQLRQHFIPVYTQVDNVLIKDCKLSSLGIGLVLLNAGTDNRLTSLWQLKVMRKFLHLP